MPPRTCLSLVRLACLACLLASVAMSAEPVQSLGDGSTPAVEPGHPLLEIEPVELRPNLLPNPSFEEPDEKGPKGWHWNPGKTDATLTVDDTVAHLGKQSIRITNTTRFGPHIFGQLHLPGGATARPNTTYTFSCYVKGNKTGIAWFGGGPSWHARGHFPKTTHGEWTRVVLPFTTNDDTNIPVMVITESPAEPFWVDDVQLVEGSEPMPVFDEQDENLSILRLESPTATAVRPGVDTVRPEWNTTEFLRSEYVFCERELWTRGWLSLPQDLTEATLTARLLAGDGKVLATAHSSGPFSAGLHSVVSAFFVADLPGGETTIEITLDEKPHGDTKPLQLSAKLQRKLVTNAETESVLKRVESLRDQLQEHIQGLRDAGRDPSYPQVTLTILQNFVGYAREDIAHGELARAHDAAVQMEAMARQAMRREFLPAVPRYVTAEERPSYRIEGPAQLGTVRWPDGRTETDRPLQLVGVGHFNQVRQDVEKLGGYGMNMIQIEFGPRSVLTGPDQFSMATVESHLALFDRAARAGVAVNLLISPHYFPNWAYEKWPHLRDAGGGFLKVDIHAPEARAVYEKYLRTIIPDSAIIPPCTAFACRTNRSLPTEKIAALSARSCITGFSSGTAPSPNSTAAGTVSMPTSHRFPFRRLSSSPRRWSTTSSASTRRRLPSSMPGWLRSSASWRPTSRFTRRSWSRPTSCVIPTGHGASRPSCLPH